MPSEMVERVAKALEGCADAVDSTTMSKLWEFGAMGGPEEFRALARAAIEAMREPTAHMIGVGWTNAADPLSPEDYERAYRASIDAALEDAG